MKISRKYIYIVYNRMFGEYQRLHKNINTGKNTKSGHRLFLLVFSFCCCCNFSVFPEWNWIQATWAVNTSFNREYAEQVQMIWFERMHTLMEFFFYIFISSHEHNESIRFKSLLFWLSIFHFKILLNCLLWLSRVYRNIVSRAHFISWVFILHVHIMMPSLLPSTSPSLLPSLSKLFMRRPVITLIASHHGIEFDFTLKRSIVPVCKCM